MISSIFKGNRKNTCPGFAFDLSEIQHFSMVRLKSHLVSNEVTTFNLSPTLTVAGVPTFSDKRVRGEGLVRNTCIP